jgi:hypothetical protein
VNAAAIRAAVVTSDGLRALYLAIADTASDIDVELVRHCQDVIGGVLGRIVTGRTEPVEAVVS